MRVTLAEETALPFADLSIDRLLLVHAIENSEYLPLTMREAWRVLSSSGRMIVVVPSRQSLWARNDKSPFGHGKPFNTGQLTRLLRDNQFAPTRLERALYMPPNNWQPLFHSALWEKLGRSWLKRAGGVILIEATKQVRGGQPSAASPFKGRLGYHPANFTPP